jgi:hypothetical protein
VVNQIPGHLLIGPAAPIAHDPDFLYRYSKRMFSVARPQFVEAIPESISQAEDILMGTSSAQVQGIRMLALRPLKPTGQPKNNILGCFEMGFLISAGITLSVILPLLGWTSWMLGRKGLECAVKLRQL